MGQYVAVSLYASIVYAVWKTPEDVHTGVVLAVVAVGWLAIRRAQEWGGSAQADHAGGVTDMVGSANSAQDSTPAEGQSKTGSETGK